MESRSFNTMVQLVFTKAKILKAGFPSFSKILDPLTSIIIVIQRLQLNTNDDGDTYAELDVQIKSNTYDGDSYAELD
eukprot:Awhi_evm1s5501